MELGVVGGVGGGGGGGGGGGVCVCVYVRGEGGHLFCDFLFGDGTFS